MTIAYLNLQHGEAELVTGARSYIYRLFSEAFSFPDERIAMALTSGAWHNDLSALARHLPYTFDLPPAPDCDPASLEQSYVSVFEVGPGKPYCPLYEGSHRNGRMKIMEELVRFYEHFGLRTSAGDHPDHLCTQLQFMHYLAFKEAASAAHGGDVTDLRRAQYDFLDRHLCRWLPRLNARLVSAQAAHDLYVHLSALAIRFCQAEAAFLKLSRGMPHR